MGLPAMAIFKSTKLCTERCDLCFWKLFLETNSQITPLILFHRCIYGSRRVEDPGIGVTYLNPNQIQLGVRLEQHGLRQGNKTMAKVCSFFILLLILFFQLLSFIFIFILFDIFSCFVYFLYI